MVVANDQRLGRARLVQENAHKLDLDLPVVAARWRGATVPPRRRSTRYCSTLRAQGWVRSVDGPMLGGGSNPTTSPNWPCCKATSWRHRRSSWRPGGRLVYSVCTITAAESVDHPTPAGFEVDPTPPPVGSWRPFEQGWRVLPHDADTDGMVMIRYRRAT